MADGVGIEEHDLRRLHRSGEIVRLRQSAYVLADRWDAAVYEGRLALRTRAILADRPDWAATHASALALHGLPLYGVPLDIVDVQGEVGRTRIRSGVRVHPRMPAALVVEREGTRCVSVPVAVAQVLLRDGRDSALVPLDAALRRGSLFEDVVVAVDAHHPKPRARARAMKSLLVSDRASESVGETRTRLLLLDLGHRVQSQLTVCDASGRQIGRVDFVVDGEVIVEFDGLVKYEGADGKQALAREKAREDRLRALGYAIVRLTWADLDHPERVAGWIRRAKKLSRVAQAA